MKAYHKAMDVMFGILKWATAALLIFAVLLMFTEVVQRYIFDVSFTWSEELIRYIIIYCTFFGGMAAYRKGELVRFDLVVLKMSKEVQLALEVFCNTVILLMSAWFVKLGIDAFYRPSIANQISATLHFSVKWVYICIPIGFAFMFLFSIENYFNYFSRNKELRARKDKRKGGMA